jgi:HEAT repeat protein
VREKAVFAISQASQEFAIPTLTDLAKNHSDITIREKAVFWLGQAAESEEVINILLEIINTDPEAQIRENAVHAISQASEELGTPALIQLAQTHPNKAIRLKAIFWLGNYAESTDIIEILLDIAHKDPDSDVQQKAIYALSQAGELGIPALIDIAKNHAKIPLRKKAIFWLGNSDDPRAKEALMQIINESN